MDGDWGKKNRELFEAYQVTGYPTVIFCDPAGKAPERMRARDAEGVAAQMRQISAKYAGSGAEGPAAPAFADYSAQSLENARQSSKPLAIYFYDDSPGSASVHGALADGLLKETLTRFVFTKTALSRGAGASAAFDVTRAPTILVLNPEAKPLARITGSRTARELKRDLEAALLPGAVAAPPSAEPSDPPKPTLTKEDEALSDDEVDRQFIQASMVPAREWLRKGNKAKAVKILEDIIQSYPKHVATADVRKFLADVRKSP